MKHTRLLPKLACRNTSSGLAHFSQNVANTKVLATLDSSVFVSKLWTVQTFVFVCLFDDKLFINQNVFCQSAQVKEEIKRSQKSFVRCGYSRRLKE